MIKERIAKTDILSEAEKVVAEYIVKNAYDCLYLSAEELGKKTFTSGSTITRVSKKLGYKGFAEFKIALATEASTAKFYNTTLDDNIPFQKTDKDSEIIRKVSDLNIYALEHTRDNINMSELRKAVNFVKQARFIDFYGTGVSYFICEDSAEKFRRIGIKATCYNDGPSMWSNSDTANQETVFLFVSYSGISQLYLKLCQELKKHGAKIITITGIPGNPLSLMGDANLQMQSEEKGYKIGAFSSRMSAMLILDYIYSLVFNDQYDKNIDFTKKSNERHLALDIRKGE